MTASMTGDFIRPVGRGYRYCLEVVRVVPTGDGGEQWQCRRWGMAENKQPTKDGHNEMSYLNNLKPIAQGIWKDEWLHATPRWMCCHLYYRRINIAGQQFGLFS